MVSHRHPTHTRSVSSRSHSTTRNTNNYMLSESAHHIPATPLSTPNSTINAASRIMSSVKRSLGNSTSKKPSSDPQRSGVISTQATERSPAMSSRFRQPDPSFSRPTVEQIAMGLHVSRTPHLRPLRSPHPHHTNINNNSSPRVTSPRISSSPAPVRSSLKRPPTSNSTSSTGIGSTPALSPASASSATVASSNPPISHSSNRSLMHFKIRMSRFLPGSRAVSAPSSDSSSPRGSTADLPTPKKAVRFSTQVSELEEDNK